MCRISLKICGMGNAERSWGHVKQLKDGQRINLDPERVAKQATLYGASCAQKARLKKKEAKLEWDWEEEDLERLGFSKLGVHIEGTITEDPKKRRINNWVEEWETPILRKNDV